MSKFLFAGGILLAAGAAASADLFTDEATFLTQIDSDYYLEEFDGYFYGSYTELSLDLGPVNGYSYTITTVDLLGLYSGDGNMSTNNAFDPLLVNFTGNDVYAVGGWFFGGDILGFYVPATVTIDLSDGQSYTFDTTSDTDFVGFTSAVPIVSMTIDAVDPFDPAGVPVWATMDHFYVGNLIPAPSTMVLLGLGALGIRRR
jgi:hypothetical protein